MKKLNIILVLALLCFGLSLKGQALNFAFRSNNQQILEEALRGAFVTLVQSYELCDSITNERFGREGKPYFSRIPFLGIETTKGLIAEKNIITPWLIDGDFKKYEGRYLPILTETSFEAVQSVAPIRDHIPPLINSDNTNHLKDFICFNDSIVQNFGLEVDSLAGTKNGWIIWVSSSDDIKTESIKLNPIKKDIEINYEGLPIQIDTPTGEESIIGGIYITPSQSKPGQLNLLITGILSYSNNEWQINFPFLSMPKKEEKPLTPVKRSETLNELPKLPKL